MINYEGLRLSQADAQILTVPTRAELTGDFSMSGVNIYDPTTSVPNPNYNPTQPTGPNNYPYTRQQFQGNQIPQSRINQKLESFLLQVAPAPNMPSMSGPDSNYYLDIRNETHFNDQGTIRVDRILSNTDAIFGRYSGGGENGFSPSNGNTATTENSRVSARTSTIWRSKPRFPGTIPSPDQKSIPFPWLSRAFRWTTPRKTTT